MLFVFYTVRKGRNTGEGLFEPVEVHIYISGGFVVTVRRAECTQLDALHHELDSADREAEDYIVYKIFDVLTDAFYPIIDALEERIDALESQILLGRPSREQLAEIYRLKQRVHDAVAPRRAPARPLHAPARTRSCDLPGPRPRHARVPARRRRPPRRRSRASCTVSRRTSPR